MTKISDVVKMISAGFKAEEIREMIKLEKELPKEEKTEPEKAPEIATPEVKTEAPKEEPKPDYEALYKKALEDLSAAQSENRSKDVKIADIKTEYEKALELFR